MTYGKDIGEEELAASALSQEGEYDAVPEEAGGWAHAREEGEGISSENEGEPEEGTSSEPDGAESVPEPEKRRENPFDDGAAYRGEIVTEAVVHERKLPHTAGLSATFETSETLTGEPGMSDSEYLAGGRPVIHYHLSDYDGPLDLLLELINDAKIDIEDIFISDVTRQYVEIIASIPREEMDFEYTGEFITIAAQLVYLKSLRTLPSDDEEDDYFEDPEIQRRDFIRKIQAFALMKEKSEKLREMETINRFYRLPAYTEKDYRVVLTNFSLPKLVEAFARVMVNADRREAAVIPKKVVKDRFSVSDQMKHILELTRYEKAFPFTSLFEPDFDKSDIVTTFLAVLELLKYGRLRAEQEETFGEIMIYAVEGAEDAPKIEEDVDGEY